MELLVENAIKAQGLKRHPHPPGRWGSGDCRCAGTRSQQVLLIAQIASKATGLRA